MALPLDLLREMALELILRNPVLTSDPHDWHGSLDDKCVSGAPRDTEVLRELTNGEIGRCNRGSHDATEANRCIRIAATHMAKANTQKGRIRLANEEEAERHRAAKPLAAGDPRRKEVAAYALRLGLPPPSTEDPRRIQSRDWQENTLPPSVVFGLRVQERRRGRGLTQAELAQRLKAKGYLIEQSGVSEIETGKRKGGVPLELAFAIAEVLQAVPAHLLTPPGDKRIRLSESFAIDGPGLRRWLISGLPWTTARASDQPAPEEVAGDVAWEQFRDNLARLAFAFADATRIDRDAANAAAQAIVDEVKRWLREGETR
jgi:transcriptional regulator with XRE-family HTH domain